MKYKKNECSCDTCVSYCKQRPGWFLPNEAEKVAKYLNLSFQEFFDKYLVLDYWEGSPRIYILCPGSKEEKHGQIASFGFVFNSKCIFLTPNNKCFIHPVKPFECAITNHSTNNEVHEWIMKKWKKYKCDFEKLLEEKEK